MNYIHRFILLVSVLVAFVDAYESQAKVAIIGAGIGGGSTAFFMQKFLKEQGLPSANITVLERNDYIGGRLKHIIFGSDQLVVEVGGAAWANDNHWMAYMAEELKINVTNGNAQNQKLSDYKVWQGDGFSPVFQLVKDDQPMTRTVLKTETEFLRDINLNYEQQVEQEPFTSINMFLQFGNMIKYTCETIMSFFADLNVNTEYVETELIPLNRAIYNQGSEANAFSLLASLDAVLSQNAVEEGNSHMVEALFESAEAKILLSTTVTKVTKTDQGKYIISTETNESEKTISDTIEDFDVVFIAAPIEQSGLQFVNIDTPQSTFFDRRYFDWFIHVVQADSVNPSQFLPYYTDVLRPIPSLIFTTTNSTSNDRTPWIMIEPLGKHAKTEDTDGVWLLYSDSSQTASLDKYFINVKESFEQYWPYTFPKLNPITGDENEVQPIVLDQEGAIYNINAMESLAPAMEVSSIGGRNAAKMAVNYIKAKFDVRDA